jgi:hypothetical protein
VLVCVVGCCGWDFVCVFGVCLVFCCGLYVLEIVRVVGFGCVLVLLWCVCVWVVGFFVGMLCCGG